MDRVFPWFISPGHLRHPYFTWLKVAVLNAITLAIYVATAVATAALVWRGFA